MMTDFFVCFLFFNADSKVEVRIFICSSNASQLSLTWDRELDPSRYPAAMSMVLKMVELT